MRRLTALVFLALLIPASAFGFSNGRLPSSALAPIFTPQLGRVAYLANDGVAAAWNTQNLCANADGVPLSPGDSTRNPAATAYRDYTTQVAFKAQFGSNAATPGYSNHGWGHAVDLRNTGSMRTWTDAHGRHFGWQKRTSDASWEAWHLSAASAALNWRRPDPGASFRYPHLETGSGGACLSGAVREVQRRAGASVDGEYGHHTAYLVCKRMHEPKLWHYVKRHHWHRSKCGQVGSVEWITLRKYDREVSSGSTVGEAPNGADEAGQDVAAVQGLLNARLHELRRDQYRVPLDGVFGDEDTVAVKRFQLLVDKYRGGDLKVSGEVDPKTYAALRVNYSRERKKTGE
jgi:hypothetical protein